MAGVGGSRLTELRRDGQLQQKLPLTENEVVKDNKPVLPAANDGVTFALTNQIIERVSPAARVDAHAPIRKTRRRRNRTHFATQPGVSMFSKTIVKHQHQKNRLSKVTR